MLSYSNAQTPETQPRVYTTEFACNLMNIYEEWRTAPASERLDLRCRQKLDATKTDRELFAAMPTTDIWPESNIHEVVLYLYHSKHCRSLRWY